MNRPRVLYVQYANPASYPPLHHSAVLLAESGYDVRLLGTALLADALSFPTHSRIDVRLMSFQPGGWRQKLHYARFTVWAIVTVLLWRPHWVYASDPLSCPVALTLIRLLGARVIYHEHDSPARDVAMGQTGTPFIRRVMTARKEVASWSALCILPNADRAREFSETTGRTDALVVWNCPRREEATGARLDPPTSAVRILYHGSVVPARVPKTVIEAISLLPKSVSLVVVGYPTAGFPNYIDELSALASQLGVASRVEFKGTLPRPEVMAGCATCDVGLSLLPVEATDVNERLMVGASNKPFEYLACGLPLLVANRPDWQATFVESGVALGCDPASADSIAAALRRFIDDPRMRREMGARGRDRVLSEWNYAAQFAPVLARMRAGAAPQASRFDTAKQSETSAPC